MSTVFLTSKSLSLAQSQAGHRLLRVQTPMVQRVGGACAMPSDNVTSVTQRGGNSSISERFRRPFCGSSAAGRKSVTVPLCFETKLKALAAEVVEPTFGSMHSWIVRPAAVWTFWRPSSVFCVADGLQAVGHFGHAFPTSNFWYECLQIASLSGKH